jgi:hypothetical protein
MGQLSSVATKPLNVEGRTEDHRHYWFHPSTIDYPLGKIVPKTDRGPEVAVGRINNQGIANRDKEWGSLKSDYGQAGKQVEQYLQFRGLQGSKSEPLIFVTELKRKRLNPSMVSAGVQSSFTSGSTISLKHSLDPDKRALLRPDKRQIGLYEASFENWPGRKPPEAGLCTSDVTQFAGAAVAQKALGRANDSVPVLLDARTKAPCPPFKI